MFEAMVPVRRRSAVARPAGFVRRAATGVLAALCAAVVLAGPDASGDVAAAHAADEAAVVARLAGQVERQGAQGKGPLQDGDAVRARDRIVTGDDGKVRLRFQDGSSIVIGPSSELEVAAYGFDGPQPGIGLRLNRGIVEALVETMPAGATFSIASPAAIAAVHGTAFIVQADASATGVFVIDGSVFVDSIGSRAEPVLVHNDQGTDVRSGQAPTEPAAWGDERIRAAFALTRFD